MHHSNECPLCKITRWHAHSRPPISDLPSTTTALRGSLGAIPERHPHLGERATDSGNPCTPVPFRKELLPPPTVFPCRVDTRSPLQRNNNTLHSKSGYESALQQAQGAPSQFPVPTK
ncbi:hypothetical protein TcCL_ESM03900 [Trypanosoma cruzi]|nr:hypothetical protein TcCL_ESM03900 [Trypanosoma cruzi]